MKCCAPRRKRGRGSRPERARLKQARANWERAILVCGKCTKKLDGGFGEKRRTPLARLRRRLPGFGKGRKAQAGVIETKCLGLCPKNAVALVDTRYPGEWLVVRAGTGLEVLAAPLATDPPSPFVLSEVEAPLPGHALRLRSGRTA